MEQDECGRTWTSQGFDPSATECELPMGHAGQHKGPSPFGDGWITWSGGGRIAGDRVPVRNVRYLG